MHASGACWPRKANLGHKNEDKTMAKLNNGKARTKIRIKVVNNTLICGVNGGNAYANPGDIIRWKSDEHSVKFTLEFFRLAFEPQKLRDGKERFAKKLDLSQFRTWPFSEPPEPRGLVVGPTGEFEATLISEPGATFKYYVTVGNLRLDPIIILDR
jgi:hypothetical protein